MRPTAIFAFLILMVASACTPATAVATPSATLPPSATVSPTASSTPTPDYSPTPPPPTATATITPTATPDTRLVPRYWREWPVSPELSARAISILEQAKTNPALDLHAFSKVGDCQMVSPTFLGGYVTGQYKVPPEFEKTVPWFATSMTGTSITSANGLGINSVLNPMFGYAAGHTQCDKEETPITCELRITHPVIVLIGMGTNWKPHADLSFEKYLRTIVDEVLATGALPILATKADNIEEDWRLNLAIAQVAYDYDLPLVNVWRSVQDLPNHGLQAPKNIYLVGDGWIRRNYAWLGVLENVRIVLEQP